MSKEESKAIQGIAILMMCYLHLFALPERIHYPYQSLFSASFQSQFACTLKICVCIYAFISGYGLCRKSMQMAERNLQKEFGTDCKMVIKKALSFLKYYWIVFILFVPIRFIIFHQPFSVKEFGSNFFCISCTYNGEWWYVAQYIKMLFLYPIIRFFLLLLKRRTFITGFFVLLCGGGFLLIFLLQKGSDVDIDKMFKIIGIAYVLAFAEGVFVAQFKLYEKIRSIGYQKIQISVNIGIIVITLATRLNMDQGVLLASRTDFVFIPFLCYSFSYLYNVLKGIRIKNFLKLLGEYSTFIWLIHTFYAYYYFQEIVFFPYYSFLIFIWLIFLSVISAYIITTISKTILTRVTGRH